MGEEILKYVFAAIIIVILCYELYMSKKRLKKYVDSEKKTKALEKECKEFLDCCKSNLRVFPYMAGIIADIETRGYTELANSLDWGSDKQRLKKVAHIREIQKDAEQKIEHAKQAQYQLEYLLTMFPSLEDLLDTEYSDLPKLSMEEVTDVDLSRKYLTKEEWVNLSPGDRNQLALDRYINSHDKTKWQIGRDYEEYVGHTYRSEGYTVENFGAYMGMEDLGRDLIAKNGKTVKIIQCKYWSAQKVIHEKHINQLFGTTTSYAIEHEQENINVIGVFVTNITLSDTARKFAERLNIEVREQFEIGDYPRIKCNIGRDGSKIYHLPFDQQYDATKIDKKGEFYAMTVAEAEKAGFRRAFKWHGNHNS